MEWSGMEWRGMAWFSLKLLQNPHVLLTFGKVHTIPCACHAKPFLNRQKWSVHVVLLTFSLGNLLRATTAYTFSTSHLPKVVGTCGGCNIFTWKFASRHIGVHFLDNSTSKSGPGMVCFVHFDLEMCFAPQRRALFSTSQLPKVVRTWFVLYISTWKRASRHIDMQFFNIATSTNDPKLRCFVHFDLEMSFGPQRCPLFRHLNFQTCSQREVLFAF